MGQINDCLSSVCLSSAYSQGPLITSDGGQITTPWSHTNQPFQSVLSTGYKRHFLYIYYFSFPPQDMRKYSVNQST